MTTIHLPSHTPESRAIDRLTEAVRAIACPPGPCPSRYEPRLARDPSRLVACGLRAGHAGDHEWRDDLAEGYARWTDQGATSRDVADEEVSP